MTTPNAVSLNILGKDYKIVCAPEEQENLINSAFQLDKQMKEIRDTGKVIGGEKIAVLAALNLAHDISSAISEDGSANTTHLALKIHELRKKIENVLENS